VKDVFAIGYFLVTIVSISDRGKSIIDMQLNTTRRHAGAGASDASIPFSDLDDDEQLPLAEEELADKSKSRKVWMLSQQIGSQDPELLKFMEEAYKNNFKFLPWAGIAARVDRRFEMPTVRGLNQAILCEYKSDEWRNAGPQQIGRHS